MTVGTSEGKAHMAELDPGIELRIYEAIRVQRPVVIAHIKEVRRTKPEATPAEVIKMLEARYLAAVTTASAGVGATAVVPGIGTAVALGLSAADLLLFFELSALFSLSVAEVHGITVNDPERARALVLGMTLGDGNKAQITKMVSVAVAAGQGEGPSAPGSLIGDTALAVSAAKSGAWGDVIATAVPEGQLNPLTKQMLTMGATKLGAKIGGETVAKILPYGIGAIVGGSASFFFGRSVVKASRTAFSAPPTEWPSWLGFVDADNDGIPDPPRALVALRAAAGSAKEFSGGAWEKVGDSVTSAANVFRSVDLDGDGIADEARAVTAAKDVLGGAKDLGAAAARLLKRRKNDSTSPESSDEPLALNPEEPSFPATEPGMTHP